MYKNDKIILKELTKEDADYLYNIYSHPEVRLNLDESPFLENETAVEFTERIISICEYIFTIRTVQEPNIIIGDCALHHWNKENKEIAIGGSLFPQYWGKNYMKYAFELLHEIAKNELGVKTIIGVTNTINKKAIRMVEKMGYLKHKVDENDIIMKREI